MYILYSKSIKSFLDQTYEQLIEIELTFQNAIIKRFAFYSK
jgi:intein-encoded DNA endonuclease-like protein